MRANHGTLHALMSANILHRRINFVPHPFQRCNPTFYVVHHRESKVGIKPSTENGLEEKITIIVSVPVAALRLCTVAMIVVVAKSFRSQGERGAYAGQRSIRMRWWDFLWVCNTVGVVTDRCPTFFLKNVRQAESISQPHISFSHLWILMHFHCFMRCLCEAQCGVIWCSNV